MNEPLLMLNKHNLQVYIKKQTKQPAITIRDIAVAVYAQRGDDPLLEFAYN